jgi:5'-3' exonuclease
MILLVDADSLIFASCYRARETPEDDKYYSDIVDARNKFDQQFMGIVNHLEDIYPIDKVLCFSGSKGNFRKILTSTYKANRTKQELPPLLSEMHSFVKEHYDSIYGYGVETDDLVARYWYNISQDIGRDNVMIVSIDKDYRQFPALIYNYHYKHKEILDITEDEAMYNFYEQFIIGDGADNVQYFRGKGKRFAEKYFVDCVTKYQYTRKIYELFKQEYKGKARQKFVECYHLLKLRTQ